MIDELNNLPLWVQHVLFPLARWVHLVCTTLLVGGTLFYEFVLPKALEDLPDEAQMAVLGRVRWVFRTIVVFSVTLLVVSGVLALWQQWPSYANPAFREVRPWVVVHAALAVVALAIGWWAVQRRRAPHVPLTWMRVNFVVLLIVIFVAVVGRHVRVTVGDDIIRLHPEAFDDYNR